MGKLLPAIRTRILYFEPLLNTVCVKEVITVGDDDLLVGLERLDTDGTLCLDPVFHFSPVLAVDIFIEFLDDRVGEHLIFVSGNL